MIRVTGLEIVYGRGTPLEKRALSGLDLAIPDHQFVSVIGSNGAGKSTLLAAIAGDVLPTAGRIEIGGEDVGRVPAARRAARVARVFQDPLAGSCGRLTIEENLALAAARGMRRGFGLALTRSRRHVFRDRLAELGLGLENRLEDEMALLSGGQRQAIALVMATLAGADVLLLDEHTAALDPAMAEFVLDLTRRVVGEKRITTLMVTHSMRQALDMGDRTVMLHEGKVILDVSGDERHALQVEDLIRMFRRVRGQDIDDDSLLIG
ncbi:putative ABC transport system ATP-binding protein [Tepidamorphus gemmatus]|uniref:Putative ABC transport system ATP-binding protein n=1 Tax=Tepidamorphus gemmatus TaxID=747076 RepID=A0A4V2UZU7_9HYPH|nr:ABC transporter ATP-binding protein [Tepidamorphus gemmatus]TCT12653.1 putative ABC transport system ATP-binding protein [Tepidamorphus gemmatus]